MRVTTKGQVTIPQRIRDKLGIRPGSEVDFVDDGSRVTLVMRSHGERTELRIRCHRGAATVQVRTDEVLDLTRDRAG